MAQGPNNGLLERARANGALLGTDLHSHVLPGIDDGARSTADSLAMLSLLASLGYERVITTPHVMEGAYPNSPETISEARQSLEELPPGLQLFAAGEYMLDEGLMRILEAGDILTLGGRHVLVECPFQQPWPGYREMIFEMQLREYVPVLAHPERYPYWMADPRGLFSLLDAGVLFQVNLMSLGGRYGPEVRRQAESLLQRGMVSYLGSDLHTVASAPDLIRGLASAAVTVHAPRMANRHL
ncbi:MAG TPA: hypothetical protein P5550_05190 [Bacteroidales bacterium]|nr:hypothetical protein [Bacteroidales bacterium]